MASGRNWLTRLTPMSRAFFQSTLGRKGDAYQSLHRDYRPSGITREEVWRAARSNLDGALVRVAEP